MPRIILKRRPSSRIDSPGLSSVPASIEPIITLDAPGGERLDDVARVLDAAVGDHRHVAGALDGVDHGGELRHADARDDARRADRARADADLHRVDAALARAPRRPRAWRRCRRRAARRGTRRAPRRWRRSTPSLCPCAVSITSTSTPASTSARARSRKSPPAPIAAATRSRPCWSLFAVGILPALVDVLDRDEALAARPSSSTTGSFSMRCLPRIALGLVERGADGRGDQPVGRHRLAQRAVEIRARTAGRGW